MVDFIDSHIKTQFCLAKLVYREELFETNKEIVGEFLHDIIDTDLHDSKVLLKGFKIITIINTDSDLQCMIVKQTYDLQSTLNIIFRGTNSGCDWMYNVCTWKTKLKDDVYVHSGFMSQLSSNDTLAIIHSVVKDHIHDCCVNFTGHSLGAGLATLACYIISTAMDIKSSLVTFASPRVGNKGFRDVINTSVNISSYRVYDWLDPVVYMPKCNYYHVGLNVCYSNEDESWIITDSNKKTKSPVWYNLKRRRHSCYHYNDIIKSLQFPKHAL